jgi:SAM-dependent methyltransferase
MATERILDEGRRDALAERLFEATLGALELFSVHIGWRLGLYAELADWGPATAADLARRAEIDERYAREWLEQQAVAGIVEVEGHLPADDRVYRLPPEHAEVLADPDSPAYVAPFGPMLAGIGGALPEVVAAYRTGEGVSFARYGDDLRDGQGEINRPAFTHDLPRWLEGVPLIGDALGAGRPLRVADVGCGQGYSTVAIARAFPGVRVDGLDADAASVEDARARAEVAGVADRASFARRDAAAVAEGGPYDLVCILEALHDMARPVEALAGARAALAPGGGVLVADERVAEAFTAPGDPIERMMFGWSVTHCLPSARAEHPSEALGTVMRTDVLRDLARRAGFSRVEVLDGGNDFLRLYWLVP